MEEDPLVARADLERRADLVRRPALDIAERDHEALARGQRLDGRRDDRLRLALEELDLDVRSPGGRRVQPVAGQTAVARRPEAAPLDGESPGPAASNEDSETVRRSRAPRVRAWLARIRKIQVRRLERPSKRSIPLMTAIHVSWTSSSATASLGTWTRASCRSGR